MFLDELFSLIYKDKHINTNANFFWHDDTPKYIKKKNQGIVLYHEVVPRRKLDKLKRKPPLIHRKIASLRVQTHTRK